MKIEIDNDVAMLVMAMETTLKKHEKAKGDSWKRCDKNFLYGKLEEEFEEWKASHDKHELVDIANICMMLFNRELWDIQGIPIEEI